MNVEIKYIYGTLGVHCVMREVEGLQCTLSFYTTTSSVKRQSAQTYAIGSDPEPQVSLEERTLRDCERKELAKIEVAKRKEEKEEKTSAFKRCKEECECECEAGKCAASGLKMCNSCESVQKSICQKKKCITEIPDKDDRMSLPKCDRLLKVNDVYSSESDDDSSDSYDEPDFNIELPDDQAQASTSRDVDLSGFKIGEETF